MLFDIQYLKQLLQGDIVTVVWNYVLLTLFLCLCPGSVWKLVRDDTANHDWVIEYSIFWTMFKLAKLFNQGQPNLVSDHPGHPVFLNYLGTTPRPRSTARCGRPVTRSSQSAPWRRHGCQMAIARFLDRMCLALRAQWTMAPLCCAAKCNPFLSLDCARVEGVGDHILPSGNLATRAPWWWRAATTRWSTSVSWTRDPIQ